MFNLCDNSYVLVKKSKTGSEKGQLFSAHTVFFCTYFPHVSNSADLWNSLLKLFSEIKSEKESTRDSACVPHNF